MGRRVILILMLLITICSMSVSAYRLDFNYTVTAEVMDICPVSNTSGDYRMRFYSNGVDRYASMTENERQYWNLTTYVDLDLEEICEDTELGKQLEEYKNITTYLTDNVDQCSKFYEVLNDTHYFASQYSNISGAYGRVMSSYENCQNQSKELKIQHDEMEDKVASLQNCISARDSCRNDLQTCTEKNEDLEKGGDNNIFWAIGGALGSWFFFGRKKKKGPSDQEEYS